MVNDLFGPQRRQGVKKFASNVLYDFGRCLGAEAQRNSARVKVDGWRECSTLRFFFEAYGWGKVCFIQRKRKRERERERENMNVDEKLEFK